MKSISLYVEEVVEILAKALHKAEEDESTLDPTLSYEYQKAISFLDDSSSENEKSLPIDGSEETSMSSDDNESSTSEACVDTDGRSRDTLQPRANTTPEALPKREKHTRNHRQRVFRARKNLPTIRISLVQNEELVVPAPLLSKDDIASSKSLPRCQSLLRLASQIGGGGQPVVILLLRSGRFAGGVFQRGKCIAHRCFQRYTIRQGQGKAQSAQDSQNRAKSMGSQLRRAGEQHLKEDISSTLLEWEMHVKKASLIFVSCPNTLKSAIFAPDVKNYLTRKDSRIRKIPFDIGRPTFESVSLVHEVMLMVDVGVVVDVLGAKELEDTVPSEIQGLRKGTKAEYPEDEPHMDEQHDKAEIPLGSLHVAARDGNLAAVEAILSKGCDPSVVDRLAGADLMTPLHFATLSAASVDAATAASCVSSLLLQGHADPCLRDRRLRLPYYLATHEKVREAFRKARAILGEDSWDWENAKVGPPLTDDDIQLRKEKEAEKKRRKKARQKEKKAKESADKREMEFRQKEEAARRQHEENSRRSRDSLQPRISNQANVCDFCMGRCKGKRQQMFFRLEYKYCSSDCVQKHKRELMASAALARFGG